jgi:hypothetical protein
VKANRDEKNRINDSSSSNRALSGSRPEAAAKHRSTRPGVGKGGRREEAEEAGRRETAQYS